MHGFSQNHFFSKIYKNELTSSSRPTHGSLRIFTVFFHKTQKLKATEKSNLGKGQKWKRVRTKWGGSFRQYRLLLLAPPSYAGLAACDVCDWMMRKQKMILKWSQALSVKTPLSSSSLCFSEGDIMLWWHLISRVHLICMWWVTPLAVCGRERREIRSLSICVYVCVCPM